MATVGAYGVLALLWWGGMAAVQAQPVYKWVDAQGRTQYGSQPPDPDTAQQPKLHNVTPSAPRIAASKTLPPAVQKDVDEVAKGLLKTTPNKAPTECTKAVDNGVSGIDTMLQTGQKNMRDGYLAKEAYEASAKQLSGARSNLSVADCTAATGAKKDFYQCLSSGRNHVLGCAQQHKF